MADSVGVGVIPCQFRKRLDAVVEIMVGIGIEIRTRELRIKVTVLV